MIWLENRGWGKIRELFLINLYKETDKKYEVRKMLESN